MDNVKDLVLYEKYRPKTLEECILPEATKQEFREYVKDKYLPSLVLAGTTGIGKSSLAQAVLNDIGAEYITVNGSKDGNIDTLRTTIQQFASTVSLFGDDIAARKYVLVEEADNMNPNSMQPALRAFIEEFAGNCGFIFTCNYPRKIMAELREGRCIEYDFKIPAKERASIAKQFYERACFILDQEGIPYEKEAVAQLVKVTFPNFRKTISSLQRYSKRGKIDSGIFAAQENLDFEVLYKALKEKNFKAMRTWVGTNSDIDPQMLFRTLFEDLASKIKPTSVPALILALGEYQFKSAIVADQEINTTALLTELMTNVEFK